MFVLGGMDKSSQGWHMIFSSPSCFPDFFILQYFLLSYPHVNNKGAWLLSPQKITLLNDLHGIWWVLEKGVVSKSLSSGYKGGY